MKRFAFIAFRIDRWPVRVQCRLLGVSPSGYYVWRKRAPAMAEQALPAWQVAAQRVFSTHAGCYGQRRLQVQLRRAGHAVGRIVCAAGSATAVYEPSAPVPVPAHHPGRPAGRGRG